MSDNTVVAACRMSPGNHFYLIVMLSSATLSDIYAINGNAVISLITYIKSKKELT